MNKKVIDFSEYKAYRNEKGYYKVLSLDIYKDSHTREFSYKFDKHMKGDISEDFVVHALTCAIEDILDMTGDPLDILELTEDMIARLGYGK